MKRETKEFWVATASLVGTMIGVGIFGVPYAMSRVGVGLALAYFVVLGGIQLLQHLFLAEAAMAVEEKQRLPGLVGRFLGSKARLLTGVTNIFGLWASLMAYVIVGGGFLFVIFGPYLGGDALTYQLVWAGFFAFVVFMKPEFVTRTAFVGTTALIIALVAVFVSAAPDIRLINLPWVNLQDAFLPYGVILFALSALPAIPQMEDTLRGRHEHYRQAIVTGTVIGVLLTAAFGLCVYGVTGMATTPDTVTGLQARLGDGIASLAAAVGFIAVMNCSFNIGNNIRTTFQFDYGRGRVSSWLLTVGVPIGLILVSDSSFVSVIGFSGAVFGGVTSVVVALLYLAVARRKILPKPLGMPPAVAYVVIAVLATGAVYEVYRTLAGWWA
ncbi:MAG: aromatic amino acid transport family protein [Patescibacteria group bacterium]|nr:aromatic amino acid transport family protein [Patescibacteria group bacterium]